VWQKVLNAAGGKVGEESGVYMREGYSVMCVVTSKHGGLF
jgi:hypothetical protein